MSGRLEGKAALVVGGGSGMGRAGAVAMANEGARVAVADIDLERAEAVAASCGGVAVAVDVCDTGSVERMVATTVERFGRLDAVYHCAVDVPFVNTQDRRLTELGEDVWDRMIDLVLTGTFRVVKYAGRQMLTQGSGSIILSSTVDALVGCAGLDSYTAAKGGVTALTRSLAAGLAPDGIRVNAIAPSFVSSEPQKVWLEDDASRTTIEQLHLLEIPTPEEIAPLVVYLASDESRRMTGTVIPLDSGYMAFKARLDVMGAMQANSLGDDAGVVRVRREARTAQAARVEQRQPAVVERRRDHAAARARRRCRSPSSRGSCAAACRRRADRYAACRSRHWRRRHAVRASSKVTCCGASSAGRTRSGSQRPRVVHGESPVGTRADPDLLAIRA